VRLIVEELIGTWRVVEAGSLPYLTSRMERSFLPAHIGTYALPGSLGRGTEVDVPWFGISGPTGASPAVQTRRSRRQRL
jgi:hypothetical protein